MKSDARIRVQARITVMHLEREGLFLCATGKGCSRSDSSISLGGHFDIWKDEILDQHAANTIDWIVRFQMDEGTDDALLSLRFSRSDQAIPNMLL